MHVWKRNYALFDAAKYFSSKLAPKFDGSYRISKQLSLLTYELVDKKGQSKRTCHVKELKPDPDNVCSFSF